MEDESRIEKSYKAGKLVLLEDKRLNDAQQELIQAIFLQESKLKQKERA